MNMTYRWYGRGNNTVSLVQKQIFLKITIFNKGRISGARNVPFLMNWAMNIDSEIN